MSTLEMVQKTLANPLQAATDTMDGTNAKIRDLQADTKDYHDKNNRITTDYGVKQTNTDDWLKVANDDHTGPMLLEDPFAREKIHRFDHERIPERVVHAR